MADQKDMTNVSIVPLDSSRIIATPQDSFANRDEEELAAQGKRQQTRV